MTYPITRIPYIATVLALTCGPCLSAGIPVARYREYAKDFNPVHYDPVAWAKLASDAGMRYRSSRSKRDGSRSG